jgi:hypothetical protein
MSVERPFKKLVGQLEVIFGTSRGPFRHIWRSETDPWRSLSAPLEVTFGTSGGHFRHIWRSLSAPLEVTFGTSGAHFRYLWRRKTKPPEMENGLSEMRFRPLGNQFRTSRVSSSKLHTVLTKSGTEEARVHRFGQKKKNLQANANFLRFFFNTFKSTMTGQDKTIIYTYRWIKKTQKGKTRTKKTNEMKTNKQTKLSFFFTNIQCVASPPHTKLSKFLHLPY